MADDLKPWGPEEKEAWLGRQTIQRSYQDDVVTRINALPADQFVVEQYGALFRGGGAGLRFSPHVGVASRLFAADRRDPEGGGHGAVESVIPAAFAFSTTSAADKPSGWPWIHFVLFVFFAVAMAEGYTRPLSAVIAAGQMQGSCARGSMLVDRVTLKRVLASNGLTLPVFNVFRMFSQMGTQRIAATSDGATDLDVMMKTGVREKPDVAALASRDGNRVTILAWHYHDDDVPGPEAAVTLSLDGLGPRQGKVKLQHFRIDAAHSNAYTAWQRLGSPAAPTPAQYKQLEAASQLTRLDGAPATLDVADGRASLQMTLPRQAVSLIVIEW